jgi:hypothetical protein
MKIFLSQQVLTKGLFRPGFLGVVELCTVEATKRSWSQLAKEATPGTGDLPENHGKSQRFHGKLRDEYLEFLGDKH